jgi:hypothetical protein
MKPAERHLGRPLKTIDKFCLCNIHNKPTGSNSGKDSHNSILYKKQYAQANTISAKSSGIIAAFKTSEQAT